MRLRHAPVPQTFLPGHIQCQQFKKIITTVFKHHTMLFCFLGSLNQFPAFIIVKAAGTSVAACLPFFMAYKAIGACRYQGVNYKPDQYHCFRIWLSIHFPRYILLPLGGPFSPGFFAFCYTVRKFITSTISTSSIYEKTFHRGTSSLSKANNANANYWNFGAA